MHKPKPAHKLSKHTPAQYAQATSESAPKSESSTHDAHTQTHAKTQKDFATLTLDQELYILAAMILGLFIIMKIAFYSSTLIATIRTTLAISWLFLLPGYTLMLRYRHELNFALRLTVGCAVATAFMGIASYYLGLAGVHVKTHGFILPFVIMALGIVLDIIEEHRREKLHADQTKDPAN